MVAAKVIAQVFDNQTTPEWLSVEDVASSASDAAAALPAPLVWMGPLLLLLLASVILVRIVLERRRRPD